MRNLTEQQFLEWADKHGLWINPKYQQSASLIFKTETYDRFWNIPSKPEKRPYFISSLLQLMGDWKSCFIWKPLGSWPKSVDPGRINDNIELHILKDLGLPLGTNYVIESAREEIHLLVTLVFSNTIFGWSCNDDIYIVPDHALYIMQTDHHGVIHASFRNPNDIIPFVQEMEQQGFSLPEDLPDETFKKPEWMKNK